MAKIVWENGVTPVNAENMNNIENRIDSLETAKLDKTSVVNTTNELLGNGKALNAVQANPNINGTLAYNLKNHTHEQTAHNHNDMYYTETEIDSKFEVILGSTTVDDAINMNESKVYKNSNGTNLPYSDDWVIENGVFNSIFRTCIATSRKKKETWQGVYYNGSWEWQQLTTPNIAFTSKGVPQNDLTGTKLGTYLTNTSGVTNLPKGWVQGRHTLANLSVGNELSYDLQLLGGYPEKALAFRIGSSDTWKEVATNVKTNVTLTANTGCKIKSQECYLINNVFYFTLEVAKTDDSVITSLSNASVIFPSPYRPAIETPCIANGRNSSGSSLASVNVMATLSSAGNLWIGCESNTTITSVQVKGHFIL